MAEAYLGIGSNLSENEAKAKIMAAVLSLRESSCIIIGASDIYAVELPYYNMVLKMQTMMDYERLTAMTKQIERSLGRELWQKAQGIVPIDIDVVVYGTEVKRQRDYDAEYFSRGYRQILEKATINIPVSTE